MKYPSYKYLMLLAGCSMLTLLSCKKDFESINTPPKGATDPTTPGFFNMIVSSLPLTGGEQSVFNSWIYPIKRSRRSSHLFHPRYYREGCGLVELLFHPG